ncbi:unnamed protein product [Caenorhabditis auriculariae]|uniref:UPAR/Ly6 domain-containing protein n=1 Tax=Caenorhabditis auriculariae TaxID=2777116 RepID=A0A8S1HE01_9PELO|nr:unnamed protein product [Caenorhabditis auriculariae]
MVSSNQILAVCVFSALPYLILSSKCSGCSFPEFQKFDQFEKFEQFPPDISLVCEDGLTKVNVICPKRKPKKCSGLAGTSNGDIFQYEDRLSCNCTAGRPTMHGFTIYQVSCLERDCKD